MDSSAARARDACAISYTQCIRHDSVFFLVPSLLIQIVSQEYARSFLLRTRAHSLPAYVSLLFLSLTLFFPQHSLFPSALLNSSFLFLCLLCFPRILIRTPTGVPDDSPFPPHTPQLFSLSLSPSPSLSLSLPLSPSLSLLLALLLLSPPPSSLFKIE